MQRAYAQTGPVPLCVQQGEVTCALTASQGAVWFAPFNGGLFPSPFGEREPASQEVPPLSLLPSLPELRGASATRVVYPTTPNVRKPLLNNFLRLDHVQLQKRSDCRVPCVLDQYSPLANLDRCYGTMVTPHVPSCRAERLLGCRRMRCAGALRSPPPPAALRLCLRLRSRQPAGRGGAAQAAAGPSQQLVPYRAPGSAFPAAGEADSDARRSEHRCTAGAPPWRFWIGCCSHLPLANRRHPCTVRRLLWRYSFVSVCCFGLLFRSLVSVSCFGLLCRSIVRDTGVCLLLEVCPDHQSAQAMQLDCRNTYPNPSACHGARLPVWQVV